MFGKYKCVTPDGRVTNELTLDWIKRKYGGLDNLKRLVSQLESVSYCLIDPKGNLIAATKSYRRDLTTD